MALPPRLGWRATGGADMYTSQRQARRKKNKGCSTQNVPLPWMRQISDFRGAYVEGRKAEFFSQHAREGMVSVKTKIWASRMQHHTV